MRVCVFGERERERDYIPLGIYEDALYYFLQFCIFLQSHKTKKKQ